MARPLRLFSGDRSPRAEPPRRFTQIDDNVQEDGRLSRTDLAVLTAIMKQHWTDSPYVYIKRATIMAQARLGERAVRESLSHLERCGHIRRERDYGRPGAPHMIVLVFRLDPRFVLENDVHATGAKVHATGARAPHASGATAPVATGARAPVPYYLI